MIRAIIESMMGGMFRSLLMFYEANAVPLNLAVLVYGLVMYTSWLNLVRIYQYLVVAMAKRIHLHPKLSAKSSVEKVAEAIPIPWEEAVSAARFPLIGSQVMLLPTAKTVAGVQRIVDRDQLIGHALEVLNGANPRKIQPTYNMMWKRRQAKKKNAKN